MTYKIGTRVKKVRPTNRPGEFIPVGSTGVISRVDVRGTFYSWDCCVRYDRGIEVYGMFDTLEPILDLHEPCESEFKESLDKLLSEVSRETV